jgi:hypothetical protein
LPREDQLRDMLGAGFRRLERDLNSEDGDDRYRVTVEGQPDATGPTAEDAYANAVLRRLEHG